MRKKLVLKIGTSTLTSGTNRISFASIENIARQIVVLRDRYHVIIVSSGAIAAARQFVDLEGSNLAVDSKQALAAIGQPKLIGIYDDIFRSFGLKVAQCLLVYRDFDGEAARINIKSTIDKLLEFGFTPVINENDTVSADEIIFGDNDKLSALVAGIIEADLLVLASDIAGLYDRNPHLHESARLIEEVVDLDAVEVMIEDRDSDLGTGGMTTKLQAARICQESGIEMWIVDGGMPNCIVEAMEGRMSFTRFANAKKS